MKKLIIPLLSLTSFCFAKEGAADELAGLIFLAIFVYLVVPVMIYAVLVPIIAICEFFKTLWGKTNTFGKLICFVLPGTAITGTMFYFLIWFAIPYIIELFCEWPIVSFSIIAGLYYLSTIITGWKYLDGSIKKRYGKYALFSRIFTSIPVLPVILGCWLIKNLFGILFIKDYRATNIIEFWKTPLRKTTFNENDLNQYLNKKIKFNYKRNTDS